MDGKRWNGKFYNNDGNAEFELKDGNGKGKEYNFFGNLIFEGEYKGGEMDGFGKEFNKNHLIFEGEYKYGKRNGKGKEYNKYGHLIFKWKYYNGKKKWRKIKRI